jgi:hypothetical protein
MEVGSQGRVLIGKVIPADCPNQTLVGRRMRCKKALEQFLEEFGRKLNTHNNTAKKTVVADTSS